MITYNKTWLYNLYVREQSAKAEHLGLISHEENKNIYESYPVGFYTPNFFIRIGLFLLTLVIALFSFGLLMLMFGDALEKSIMGMFIFFGLMAGFALEAIIRTKHHYRSGVDDALTWIAAGMLLAGIGFGIDPPANIISLLSFLLALVCMLRYTDRVMSLVAHISLLCFAFYTCYELGGFAKAIVPFILMMINGLVYFLAKRGENVKDYFHYQACFSWLQVASLLGFFIAGNYYIVRELSNLMFDLNLPEGASIPFGPLFWSFTIIIPLVYLFAGIRTKNTILVRCGMITTACMILTIQYYYPAPAETIMTLGGLILTGVCYFLIRFLKEPRQGITYEDVHSIYKTNTSQVESLIIDESFGEQQITETGTRFGGGSFGGAGAGDNF